MQTNTLTTVDFNTGDLFSDAEAKQPVEDLKEEEKIEALLQLGMNLRKQAWSAGRPFYYNADDLLIAEYESGQKMVVEKLNGELVPTREYEDGNNYNTLEEIMAHTLNYVDLFSRGEAKKPFGELTPEELKEVNERVGKQIRQEAWSVGAPIYYGIDGLWIAEYESGKKMVVETVNGERVETREYEGKG